MFRRLQLLCAALPLVMACQNNTIMLEDGPDPSGSNNTEDSGGSDTIDPTTGDVQTPETMLLAIRTIWNDANYIQGYMTSTPSGGTTDITLQFLSLEPGSNTSPRELVGPEYTYPAVPLEGDGGFLLDAGQITIVAAANPINALDIETTLLLVARPAGSPYCGEVTGNVSAPVVAMFDGSTHAMTSVPSVTELPTTVVAACP